MVLGVSAPGMALKPRRSICGEAALRFTSITVTWIRLHSVLREESGEMVTPSETNEGLQPSKMPEFEMSEKVLHALQTSNRHSAKLVGIGYALVWLLAIITLCMVIPFGVWILGNLPDDF